MIGMYMIIFAVNSYVLMLNGTRIFIRVSTSASEYDIKFRIIMRTL